jgi:hypothetical protein
MLNKLLLFIVLFLANLIANAQYIKLEKMNFSLKLALVGSVFC